MGFVKPGARFSEVTKPIENSCKNFGPSDYVVIFGGANDVARDQANEIKIALKCVLQQTVHTNVLVINQTQRHDLPSWSCVNQLVIKITSDIKDVCGKFEHANVIDAAIGYQVDGNLEWNCGGSLISEYYVLTAAHCTHIGKYPAVIVRLGEYNLKSDDDGALPVDYHIADLVRHPEYKGPSKYNDIALLRLSERVNFTWPIRPACLYTLDKFSDSRAIATGWGKTEYAGKSSDILQKVDLDIVDNEMCNNLWKSLGKITSLPHGIAPSMLCAGVSAGDKDTCQGDSGGPLQMSFKIGRQHLHHVIGVTSFGNYCAGKDSPGVYTRVSYFIPWIESIVWPDG
ncbi:serine protease snake-like [Schistocerca nitens]|uniref:serine protease snake-like n=1 Tax=Schistocerca nitens TaxID=7011 RepID=UPI0021188850|nr:serine protease snake-like [Schistocerca nitens]